MFRGSKKREKPLPKLVTAEGKVLNINIPKYVRKQCCEEFKQAIFTVDLNHYFEMCDNTKNKRNDSNSDM